MADEKQSEKPVEPTWCCGMRRRFLIGLMMEFVKEPKPPELVNFLDWDRKGPTDKPVIKIKFCPFCGKEIFGKDPDRIGDVTLRSSDDEEGEEWKKGGEKH